MHFERGEFIHRVLKTKEEAAEEKKMRTMDMEGGKLIRRRAVSLFFFSFVPEQTD